MNKLKSIFTFILLFIIVYILFKYNLIITSSTYEALNIFIKKVFPSLFITFIINNIIISTNILKYINIIINPIFNKIFKTTMNSGSAFLLSIFSGTPGNILIINELLDNNKITLNDANKLLRFTYFSNPLFLYNILSISFNKHITIKIIIIHYITNIFIGLFNKKDTNNNLNTIENNKIIFNLNIIPTSIKKSLNATLNILGTICFYLIITNILINIFNPTELIKVLLKGTLEITQGLNTINTLNNISIIKEIIALSIISFGGLSIHTQVLSEINSKNNNLEYKYFLKGRILHVILSTIIYTMFYTI